MKELVNILRAYELASENGLETALATVVHVEGSSYRKPGARMLISENGQLSGAISGGCLEGDVLRRARLAMVQQRSTLVKYDTNDDDDSKLGVGLGCNGIIHILIEPIVKEDKLNPIHLLRASQMNRKRSVLLTVFSMDNRKGEQKGTCMLVIENGEVFAKLPWPKIAPDIREDMLKVLVSGNSLIKGGDGDERMSYFYEVLEPPLALFIVGAGNDAIPLCNFADVLGYKVTVIDGRANYATRERFSSASSVMISRAEEIFSKINTDSRTAFVLMTHNYNYDLAVLRSLLKFDIPYVGCLGPLKRLERMKAEIAGQGITITNEQKDRIYGPAGIDLGSDNAEEIALSIISEIQRVIKKSSAISLRDKHCV